MSHKNSGHCEKCVEIINTYPNFNRQLRDWFADFQEFHPEFHVSCAGRGEAEQEQKKKEGKSRASFGESAHSYNCAIDLFINGGDHELYDEEWFEAVLGPIVPIYLEWYGRPEYKKDPHKFWELPHIELKNWRLLGDKGLVKLVGTQ